MTIQTAIAIALIVGFAVAQYTFTYQALRDLLRRPRVRGGNKMAWALVILCVPVAGALIYGWMGPASLIRRNPSMTSNLAARKPARYPISIPSLPNITPIGEARERQKRAPQPSRHVSRGRRFPDTGS